MFRILFVADRSNGRSATSVSDNVLDVEVLNALDRGKVVATSIDRELRNGFRAASRGSVILFDVVDLRGISACGVGTRIGVLSLRIITAGALVAGAANARFAVIVATAGIVAADRARITSGLRGTRSATAIREDTVGKLAVDPFERGNGDV